MRRVKIRSLKGSEILAKNIYDSNGRVLLSKGTKMKHSFSSKLETMGIDYIYITDKVSEGIEIEDFVSEKVRKQSIESVKKLSNIMKSEKPEIKEKVISSVQTMIDNVISQREVMINILDLRNKDEYLFYHSVNTCAMSILLGNYLGYNMLELRDLALGAILHDIGKLELDNNIIGKYDFSDDEIKEYNSHPEIGYKFLKKDIELSAVTRIIVLNHHENLDGSGFPLGIKSNKIHRMAKVVRVCNDFDNYTTLRGMNISDTMNDLEKNIGIKYDKDVVKALKSIAAFYPSGSIIELEDNRLAIVINQNIETPNKPIIKIIEKKGEEILPKDEIIDLSKENIGIIRTLEDLNKSK